MHLFACLLDCYSFPLRCAALDVRLRELLSTEQERVERLEAQCCAVCEQLSEARKQNQEAVRDQSALLSCQTELRELQGLYDAVMVGRQIVVIIAITVHLA